MATERELIEASQQGDREAFAELIRRYEDKIYDLARHVCAQAPQEADGIYQETFLTAFTKIGLFQHRSALGTWLYRIASNLCLMRLRTRKRHPSVPLTHTTAAGDENEEPIPELHDLSSEPSRQASKRELQAAVARALEELPIDYRLVVTMRDIQGLPADDVAQILKLSVPAVKSRLHRGRAFLRERLQPLFGR